MTIETGLTDEQIVGMSRQFDSQADFARAIEQAVLQSAEVQALRQRVDDMEKIVADCRDAMPIPNVGSKAEKCWPEAMSDADGVPDFIRASIEAWKEDAERYRYLRQAGVDYSTDLDVFDAEGNCLNEEELDGTVDAAMERRP